MITLTVFFIQINVKEIDIYEFACLEEEWIVFRIFENVTLNFQVYSWNTLEQIMISLNLTQNIQLPIPFTSSRRKNSINVVLLAC